MQSIFRDSKSMAYFYAKTKLSIIRFVRVQNAKPAMQISSQKTGRKRNDLRSTAAVRPTYVALRRVANNFPSFASFRCIVGGINYVRCIRMLVRYPACEHEYVSMLFCRKSNKLPTIKDKNGIIEWVLLFYFSM